MSDATKHCNKCDEDWPADLEFFFSDPGSEDGLYYCCKACYREQLATRKRRLVPACEQPHITDHIAPLIASFAATHAVTQ